MVLRHPGHVVREGRTRSTLHLKGFFPSTSVKSSCATSEILRSIVPIHLPGRKYTNMAEQTCQQAANGSEPLFPDGQRSVQQSWKMVISETSAKHGKKVGRRLFFFSMYLNICKCKCIYMHTPPEVIFAYRHTRTHTHICTHHTRTGWVRADCPHAVLCTGAHQCLVYGWAALALYQGSLQPHRANRLQWARAGESTPPGQPT